MTKKKNAPFDTDIYLVLVGEVHEGLEPHPAEFDFVQSEQAAKHEAERLAKSHQSDDVFVYRLVPVSVTSTTIEHKVFE